MRRERERNVRVDAMKHLKKVNIAQRTSEEGEKGARNTIRYTNE